MNKIVALTFYMLLTANASLQAQEFKAKFNGDQNRKVVLEMQSSDVNVEGYDGDELIIHRSRNEASSEQAQEPRSVHKSIEDNTQLGLSITSESGNALRVVRASRQDATYNMWVPHRTTLVFAGKDQSSSGLVVQIP